MTQSYPGVLQITGYGFTPNFWADIKLVHPYPGTGINGYDPRVIAILPANAGVRFIYPVMGVGGNNAVVMEPDGYTGLHDSIGGAIAGNVNPFRAYFKDQPNRVWSGTGATMETQRWQMNLGGFGGPLQFKLVVDVSTNYPNPPQPVIDNAKEPVSLAAIVGAGLTTAGGSADVTVTLLDWQGPSTIGGVNVEAPGLFSGTVSLAYSTPGPNPNEYVYTGTIANSLLAPAGEYKLLVATWDLATGINIYNEFTANVESISSNDGNLVWAKRAGGSSNEYSRGITTLSDDSTVVTGRFTDISTFGSGELNQVLLTTAGYDDIFIARYDTNGTLTWAKRAGGVNYDESMGITSLSDNSTAITGYFQTTATFGLGETNETALTAIGPREIFIARYNADGTLAWAKSAGGPNLDYGYGVATLSDNSIIVIGYYYVSATFGLGEPNQTVLTNAGGTDTFIARYNPNGTLAWAKRAGGGGYEWSYGVTSLSDNSSVVTGLFENSATFGLGEINQTVLNSTDAYDIFIARYNADGTLAWAKSAGGLDHDYGYGITSLSDNSTVVTGFFNSSCTFGLGEPNETVLTSVDLEDIFIARYNSDGTLAWAKQAGGGGYTDKGLGVTSLSDNSIVATGFFWGSSIFGSGDPNQTILTSTGGSDIFVARYNPNGTLAWAKRAGGTSYEEENGYSITTLSDDSTVATGYFNGPAIFGLGELNQTILTGYKDIFIAKFEP